MAIAFRAAQRDAGGTGTSRAFTAPASRVAGDCLLLDAEIVSLTATINTPSGWNVSIPSTASTDQTTNARFWRVATADASDSGTLTWSGSASIFADSVMCAYSGCDTTNPVNVSSSAMQNNAASTNCAVPAVTTTVDNCLPVSVVHNNQGQSVTPAAGWTEDTDTTGGPEVAHKNSVITPAGTTGTVTHTMGASFKSATGMTALQPPQAIALAGQSSGTSTDTGATTVAHSLGATSAGSSTDTVALKVAHTLVATSAGLSADTGALTSMRPLAGTSTGGSTDTAAVRVVYCVAGTSAGHSTLSGVFDEAGEVVVRRQGGVWLPPEDVVRDPVGWADEPLVTRAEGQWK